MEAPGEVPDPVPMGVLVTIPKESQATATVITTRTRELAIQEALERAGRFRTLVIFLTVPGSPEGG